MFQLAYNDFAVKFQVGQINSKHTHSFSKGGFRIQAVFHFKLWFLAVRPNTPALDIVQICGEISLRQGQIQLKHSQIHHSAFVFQAVMLFSCFLVLLALITALVEWTCDKQMSLWLLLYSLLPLLVCSVLCRCRCRFAILASILPNEEDKKVVQRLDRLLISCIFLIIYLIIVLFFPTASSHPCCALSIVSSTCKLVSQVLNFDPFHFSYLQVATLICVLDIVDLFCTIFYLSSAANTVVDNEVTNLQCLAAILPM